MPLELVRVERLGVSGTRLDVSDEVTAHGVVPATGDDAGLQAPGRGLGRTRNAGVGGMHDSWSHTFFRLAPWV
jgi:hypothetical protein